MHLETADLIEQLRVTPWQNPACEDGDVAHTEDNGCLPHADPSVISPRALERGRRQLGTLGSGNHFLEVDVVDTVYDEEVAGAWGLFEGQVAVLLHTGSRGFGYQVNAIGIQVL